MGAVRPATPGLRALAAGAVAVAVLVPVLAACGAGTGGTSPSPAGASSATGTPEPAPARVGGGSLPTPSLPGTPTAGQDAVAPPDDADPGAAGDRAADDEAGDRAADDPAGDTRDPVDVVVTYSAWIPQAAEVQVGAYVADVVEDGGVCTLRLVGSGGTVTAQATGTADVTVTGCGALAVDGPALAAGRWTGTVEYTSPTSTGQSAPVEIEVP